MQTKEKAQPSGYGSLRMRWFDQKEYGTSKIGSVTNRTQSPSP